MVERGASSNKMWQTYQGYRNRGSIHNMIEGAWVTLHRVTSGFDIQNYVIKLVGKTQTYTDAVLVYQWWWNWIYIYI